VARRRAEVYLDDAIGIVSRGEGIKVTIEP
jgi:hypothetical protein